MEWNIRKGFPLAALSLLGMTSSLSAARNSSKDMCAPEPAAPCYTVDEPACQYCLGPQEVNPAVNPKTCNGDVVFTVAGFYWNAHQDGMEYAIDNQVVHPTDADTNQALNNLIDSTYKNPDFKWDFGFKVGLGYNTTHDGWDIGVVWTQFRTSADSHVEAEADDNHTLLPLWSAFAATGADSTILWASDIETHWKLKLDLVDLELGREFWTSKYLTFRPFVGLRLAWINQEYNIKNKGGGWLSTAESPAFNNLVDIDQKFHGVGLRGGVDTVWNFGCGWGIFGNFAMSIVYGRFNVDHDESNREATDTHHKTKILESDDNFRASRGMTDLSIGLQWHTMFSNCRYGFTAMLGWEHHMFFDQNQMWRVLRKCDEPLTQPNLSGENVFHQRRGDLATQGWTLTFVFEF